MMRAALFFLLFICLNLIGGCKEENGVADLIELVEGSKLGENTAYWFELHNSFGEWEKTLLVFGYWDNLKVCYDLLGYAEKDASFREYRCVPAN